MGTRTLRLTPVELARLQGKRNPNKFNATKKVVDGILFDSAHEAERYMALRLEEKAGIVANIKLHVPIQVEICGQHAFTYLCDFVYARRDQCGGWTIIHEDAKGYRKGAVYQLFKLKQAVIRAALGIVIEEV